MKVQVIKAFKSNDGCIWESETEALNQNIEDCIHLANIKSGDGYSETTEKIKAWFKSHPKCVKYILANINKI